MTVCAVDQHGTVSPHRGSPTDGQANKTYPRGLPPPTSEAFLPLHGMWLQPKAVFRPITTKSRILLFQWQDNAIQTQHLAEALMGASRFSGLQTSR